MNIYNLRLPGDNHHFLPHEAHHGADKIAGLFSTASIPCSFIKYLVTTNARIFNVNKKHTSTTKTISKPAFEIANSWVIPLIKPVQNNWVNSFVRENFLKGILGVNSWYAVQLRLRCTLTYFIPGQQTTFGQINESKIPAFVRCP